MQLWQTSVNYNSTDTYSGEPYQSDRRPSNSTKNKYVGTCTNINCDYGERIGAPVPLGSKKKAIYARVVTENKKKIFCDCGHALLWVKTWE